MRSTKKLGKKIAAMAAVSTLTLSCLPMNVFAYGEVNVGTSTFKSDTDNSTSYQTWRANVWQAGEYADSGKIALTPGKTEKDLNFAWYSETKATPAVRVWKSGQDVSAAEVFLGTADDISAENWQGSTYAAANKVNIENYFESNTKYNYQYTSDYKNGGTVWSSAQSYNTADFDSFSVILTGDPQVGASGSSTDEDINDDSVARDTYNWNLTMQQALKKDSDAAFLLSAGDQIDKSGATSSGNKKTRESEYAGYLYPSVFRSLPIASTIGNHDMAGADYSNHFNNPNSEDNLGATAAGSDYYFSYGDVLFISLNSNNRNQEEHRQLMEKAVASNESAKWKVVIFHSDIYGSGEPHADTDAATNRIIFAPLMDEFDIDICLTGHDHTYSRSYQILDGNVVNYDISDGSVTDPEGTLYITTGSGSGSKYYNLLNYTPYYIAERTNECLPAFSTIDFNSTSLTIKTYDYTGNKYADDFTINKTDVNETVDEVIKKAENKLSTIDKTKYTEDSVKNLETQLSALKELAASYTTAEDKMIADITEKYNTAADRIKGYGSIANDEDKDTLTDGSLANRLKKGESTLLDKTIYSQISQGELIANAVAPTISSTKMLAAKGRVNDAIAALKEIEPQKETETEKKTETEADTTTGENQTTDKADEETTGNIENTTTKAENPKADESADNAPKTGDNSSLIIVISLVSMIGAGAAIALTEGKRRKECDEK